MAKGSKKAEEMPAPETIRVGIHRIDPETEEPYFSATSKGVEVARIWGKFYIPIPATLEAAEVLCAGATSKFEGEDGEDVVLEGPLAPLARKYYADLMEPQRGRLREAGEQGIEITAEEFQAMLDEAQPYTGRGGGFRKAVVSRDSLAEIMEIEDEDERLEALAAYMKKAGAVVTD